MGPGRTRATPDVVTSPEANPPARAPWVAIAPGLYAAVIGLTSFIGWVADLRRLTDWYNSGISIQPNTTIAAMAAGAAVVSLALDKRRAAAAWGLLAGVIGAMTVLQFVLNVDLGVDALLLFGRPWGRLGAVAPGRMGPPAATSFTLLGIGLIFAAGIPRFRQLAPAFGLMVAGIATLSLMGYIFKASVLYTVPRLTTIAFQPARCSLHWEWGWWPRCRKNSRYDCCETRVPRACSHVAPCLSSLCSPSFSDSWWKRE